MNSVFIHFSFWNTPTMLFYSYFFKILFRLFFSLTIGSLSEPKDLPGLAHFCEHMLFLGTKKYPIENEFTQFLTQNGGSYNAYTANDHTNYYFSTKTESLEPTLDR